MITRVLLIASVLVGLSGTATSQTLPLPTSLLDFRANAGAELLLESEARTSYFPLASNFLTQENQAFCGVASIVMVLNALQLPAPTTPEFEPYHTFTQANFLDVRTEAILPQEVLRKQGMTLDQIGGLLSIHPVNVAVRHAAESTLDVFRAEARDHLSKPDHFVIVNYLRAAIGQERGGHISPLAAYDEDTDRFLILDVARYKYPPVWVAAADLFNSMNTTDSDNQDRTRGYVLISKR